MCGAEPVSLPPYCDPDLKCLPEKEERTTERKKEKHNNVGINQKKKRGGKQRHIK